MESNDKCLVTCSQLLFLLVYAIVFGSLFGGYVFSTLWGWFIVPLGFPVVTVFQSLGIMLVVGMVLMGMVIELNRKPNKKEDQDIAIMGIPGAITVLVTPVAYLVILLVGWIYHSLMIAYPGF